jgi:hypothetical protein
MASAANRPPNRDVVGRIAEVLEMIGRLLVLVLALVLSSTPVRAQEEV